MERKLSRAVHVTRLRHRLVNRTLGSETGPGTPDRRLDRTNPNGSKLVRRSLKTVPVPVLVDIAKALQALIHIEIHLLRHIPHNY